MCVILIISIGDQHQKKIRAIAMFKKLTFTATGNEIYVSHSAKKVIAITISFQSLEAKSRSGLGRHVKRTPRRCQLLISLWRSFIINWRRQIA